MRRLHPVLVLLILAILAYALLIPQMGFYWDEVPMSWIRYELGPAAMTRYFSTNRPVWGLLYQVTTRILPQIPIDWQIFALLWRWMTAVLVWALVCELWPGRQAFALTTAALFLVYPGFNQQWTSYLYSHFFIVLCFFLFSFLCMLWSFRAPPGSWKRWLLGAAAVLFSALNLWMLEYFFVLELLRPFLIFYFISATGGEKTFATRLRHTVALWIPYLAVFVADVLWRLLVFNDKIYQPTLIPKLKAAPLATLGQLIITVLSDLYKVSLGAWAQVFPIGTLRESGPRTLLFYLGVVIVTAAGLAAFLFARRAEDGGGRSSRLWPLGFGLVAMLFGGAPFWLTGLEISLAHPANRFTLPFMLGVSLLLAGLMEFLPVRWRIAIVVALVALAAGRQALWADAYRRDWAAQKSLFWQMIWRAPGIQPGTVLLLNQGPLQFYADNSLTGALNWIYDPEDRSGAMDYVLFYPTSRMQGSLPKLEPGQPVKYDFISEEFTGNTSQILAFYYAPPGCLRLLDPELDAENHFIAEASLMREGAKLSSAKWITAETTARMPGIYGPEPAHGWCYYFEKAELARQEGDWAQIVELGDKAFTLNDYPNDPVERFVFIEAYAHEGNWTRARDLAMQSYKVAPAYVSPLLCRLLQRIDEEAPGSNLKESSLNDLRTQFECLP